MKIRCLSTTSIGHSAKSLLLPSRQNNKHSKPNQLTLIWIQLRFPSLSHSRQLTKLTTHPSNWYAQHHKPHLRIGLKSPQLWLAKQPRLVLPQLQCNIRNTKERLLKHLSPPFTQPNMNSPFIPSRRNLLATASLVMSPLTILPSVRILCIHRTLSLACWNNNA